MSNENSQSFIKYYAQLVGFLDVLKEMTSSTIEQNYVKSYHKILDEMKNELEIGEFYIPTDMVTRRVSIATSHGTSYTDPKVDRAFMLIKLKGLITFLEMSHPEYFRK